MMYLDIWESDSIMKIDLKTIYPFRDPLNRIGIFSEIEIFWEKLTVLELCTSTVTHYSLP
jgi:hypothetical protein